MTIDDESTISLNEVVALLRSADTSARFEATEALGNRGVGQASAVDALVAAMRDPQLLVRLGAIKALGRIGKSVDAAAVQPLLAAMDQPEQLVQAAWALGKIGANTPVVLARLRGLLNDDDAEAREVAAMALWRIEHDPDAVRRIGDVLGSGDPMLVAIAARDLIEIGRPSAAARLDATPEAALRALRDPSRMVTSVKK